MKKIIALLLCVLLAQGGATFAGAATQGAALQAENSFETSLYTSAAAAPQLQLPCKNALLMCADTGDVLYEMGADDRVCIASITKVMTLLLTMEAIDAGKVSLQDKVPVSAHAYGMGGSQIWIEPGENFTLDEMIKAICISSANDAAVAVAEFIGGSEPVFVEMMNARAAQLGMANTHFMNACGLDEENHYSSARDVAIMSMELLHHQLVLHYSSIWMDSLRGGATQLTNTNKLLKTYTGTIGLKTGTTGKAGVCISACARRDGTTMLAVVLGSASGEERFAAAKTLLDYGFSNFEVMDFPMPRETPGSVKISGGTRRSAPVVCDAPQKLLVNKGSKKNLTSTLEMRESLAAPITGEEKIGTLHVLQDGTEVAQYSLHISENVEKIDFRVALSFLLKEVKSL